jgi:phage shock protein C
MVAPTTKRLYKSRTSRMIDGVCGGIAEYFGIDPTLVRIAWVLLVFVGGMGILLYIAAMIIMPKSPVTASPGAGDSSGKNSKFWGILLIAVGIVLLMNNLGVSLLTHWWHIPWGVLFSVLLMLAGVAFLMGGRNGLQKSAPPVVSSADGGAAPAGAAPAESTGSFAQTSPRLEKSRVDRKIFGVCGGIANHLGVDPTLVRFAFVLGAFASFGLALLTYILLAIFVPTENPTPAVA